jgi:chitodextrinase
MPVDVVFPQAGWCTPEMFDACSISRYPAWQANHGYAAGDRVSYAGQDYQCTQGHTSLSGWEPPYTAALWQALT